MDEWALYIDGSTDTKSKIGFGAYLLLDASDPSTGHESEIKVKQFERTSSTKLELQTLLWAFEQIESASVSLFVYTDSQNLVSLPRRRSRLEENEFKSKKGVHLRNHELYREFFAEADRLNCHFIKVKGHRPGHEKDEIDKRFAQVDRASRKALREWTSSRT